MDSEDSLEKCLEYHNPLHKSYPLVIYVTRLAYCRIRKGIHME